MTAFSNEELTAFLDGEASPGLVEKIERSLRENPTFQERLDALALDKPALVAAFDDLLPQAPAAPLPAPRPSASVFPRLAAIAAALLLAVGAGWLLGQNDKPGLTGWQDFAAAYHRLYVTETLSKTDFEPNALASQLAVVSNAVDSPFDLDTLATIGGLTLKRAQVLGMDGQRIAHIAFLGDAGTPFALCVSRDGAPDAGLAIDKHFGLATARWTKDGVTYFLIGGPSNDTLERASTALHAAL